MNTVLYHDKCIDGFMARFLMELYFTELNIPAKYIAVNYNEPIPKEIEGTVYIVDFSYPMTQLEELGKLTNDVHIWDHHKTAADHYNGYGQYKIKLQDIECDINVVLDKDNSGAKITHTQLLHKLSNLNSNYTVTGLQRKFLNNRLIDFVNRISDRDLWLFKYEDSKVYNEILNIYPRQYEYWKHLILGTNNSFFNELLNEGRYRLTKHDDVVRHIASEADFINRNDIMIPIVNCPKMFASDVGAFLGKDKPYSITYYINKNKIYVSLRSNKETGVDVSEIAKRYNGGGHINAAGFQLDHNKLTYLLDGFIG